MNSPLKKYFKVLLIAEAALFFVCLTIVAADFLFGNGDGIIDSININALTVFIFGQVCLLPLIGMTRSQKYVANISLMVFTFIVFFFLMEILVRFLPTSTPNNIPLKNLGSTPIFSKYDEIYFKNYLPNTRFITQINELDTNLSVLNEINSLGIRGPEIEPKKSGQQRILLLGDSFLQSDEVTYENTVGKRLESLLGDSTLVIQHGQPSWSPLLELNWLLRQGAALEIDHVILFLYDNDFLPGNFVADKSYTKFALFDKKGYPKGFDFSSAKPKRNAWTKFVEEISYLSIPRWLNSFTRRRRVLQNIPINKIPKLLTLSPPAFKEETLRLDWENNLLEARLMGLIATTRDTSLWDSNTRQRVALSEHYLMLMQQWLSNQQIDLTITLIPNPWQFTGGNNATRKYYGLTDFVFPKSGLEKRFQHFCNQNGISYFSLNPAFADFKKEKSQPLYFRYDGHWTPAGHQLAAEALFDYYKNSTFNLDREWFNNK